MRRECRSSATVMKLPAIPSEGKAGRTKYPWIRLGYQPKKSGRDRRGLPTTSPHPGLQELARAEKRDWIRWRRVKASEAFGSDQTSSPRRFMCWATRLRRRKAGQSSLHRVCNAIAVQQHRNICIRIAYGRHCIKEEGLAVNHRKSLQEKQVRETGVEPARVSPLDPKSSASANSATLAKLFAVNKLRQ